MAKFTLNPQLGSISGRLGDFVFRQRHGRTFISSAPAPRRVKATPAQAGQQLRFKQAITYARLALENPVAGPFYRALANGGISPFAIATRDCLRSPEISEIALGLYQGFPGDEIIVTATDDTEVIEVRVQVKDATGKVIEQGLAEEKADAWVYDTTARAPAGQPMTIEVTASDRPGNRATRTIPWVPETPATVW